MNLEAYLATFISHVMNMWNSQSEEDVARATKMFESILAFVGVFAVPGTRFYKAIKAAQKILEDADEAEGGNVPSLSQLATDGKDLVDAIEGKDTPPAPVPLPPSARPQSVAIPKANVVATPPPPPAESLASVALPDVPSGDSGEIQLPPIPDTSQG